MAKHEALSELENEVMQILWEAESATAEEVRKALKRRRRADLKDSTVRTLLRRIEDKGYLDHSEVGRTYVYRPLVTARPAPRGRWRRR